MAAANITPEMGFCLVACEQAQDALASAAKILARFSQAKACVQSAALLVEMHNRIDQHRQDLLKQASGGIVLAATIPQGARQ